MAEKIISVLSSVLAASAGFAVWANREEYGPQLEPPQVAGIAFFVFAAVFWVTHRTCQWAKQRLVIAVMSRQIGKELEMVYERERLLLREAESKRPTVSNFLSALEKLLSENHAGRFRWPVAEVVADMAIAMAILCGLTLHRQDYQVADRDNAQRV